jgi:hypothetical protein
MKFQPLGSHMMKPGRRDHNGKNPRFRRKKGVAAASARGTRGIGMDVLSAAAFAVKPEARAEGIRDASPDTDPYSLGSRLGRAS